MFLELFKVVVHQAAHGATRNNSTGYGLEHHAMYECNVTLRFVKGCNFTIHNAPLIAVQQFFGACAHYGMLTDDTIISVVINGELNPMSRSGIMNSLNSVKPLVSPNKYSDSELAVATVEMVITLLQACPQHDALTRSTVAQRDKIAELTAANAKLTSEVERLSDNETSLEFALHSLRANVETLREKLAEAKASAESDAKSITALQTLLEAERETRSPTPSYGNCPAHYDLGELGEVLDVCRALSARLPDDWNNAFIGGMFLELVKYVLRAPRKNGVDDLRKSRHYIDIIIGEIVNG